MPTSVVPSILAIALMLGCGGTPAQPTATPTPVVVSGTLTADGPGWTFHPADRPNDALPVPDDVAAVIAQIVAGEVTPGRATLEVVSTDEGPSIVGWRCIECRPPAPDVRWAVHGNEPFWGLLFTDGEAQWATPETPPVVFSTRPEGAGRYTLTGTDGAASMTVLIEEKTCDDSMADARWHATVTVEKDGLTFHGCGIAGR